MNQSSLAKGSKENQTVRGAGRLRITQQNTIEVDKDKCKFCRNCIKICPMNVFSSENSAIVLVNEGACIACMACQRSCPASALKVVNRNIKKFYISRTCNNSCVFCFEEDNNIRKNSSTDEVLNEFRQNISGEEKMIILSGAEITTRNDIFVLLRELRTLNLSAQVFLPTNGRMMSYPWFVDKLLSVGLSDLKITVTLLGNKENHDLLSRVPGSFEQTTKGIRNLLENKQNINLNVPLMKQNYMDLPWLVGNYAPLGVRTIQLSFIEPCGRAEKQYADLVPRVSDMLPYLKKALQAGLGKIFVRNIPRCFLDGEDVSWSKDTVNQLKLRPDACSECVYSECKGIWKKYIDIYGETEITPVKR